MAMDDRKMRILQAIIDDYILTGVPVGSRTISKKYDMGLSSATIRNEMSDLEELGFLDQPHVSAGRIPSAKAYRLYVDTLLEAGAIPDTAGSDAPPTLRDLALRCREAGLRACQAELSKVRATEESAEHLTEARGWIDELLNQEEA